MSLNEIFCRIQESLNEIFSRIWESIAWAWNYPIPWAPIFEAVGYLIAGGAGIVALFYGVKGAAWVLKVLWDITEIAFLLARRQLRKLVGTSARRS